MLQGMFLPQKTEFLLSLFIMNTLLIKQMQKPGRNFLKVVMGEAS